MTTTTCPSTHWSLPAPCILPPGHHEVWHEAQFTNGRIRYRRAFGVFATELLRDGVWVELSIAPPETPETEVERLKARIAELEAERHSTNEALSEAAEALRTKDQRIAELESHAQKLVDGWKQASDEHAAYAKSEAMAVMPGMADKQEGRALQLLDCADELADVLKGEDPDDWEYGIGVDVLDRDERTAEAGEPS